MSVYLLRAPAKLNLYLRVFDKTEDGYHEIESLTQTIDLSDYLEVEFTKGVGIKVNVTSGSFNVNPEANTLIRTYEVLEEEYGGIDFGLVVKLHKRIPIGGGLGGGSSDAAALLRFLRGVLGISMDETLRVAFKVGSDVPALFSFGVEVKSWSNLNPSHATESFSTVRNSQLILAKLICGLMRPELNFHPTPLWIAMKL